MQLPISGFASLQGLNSPFCFFYFYFLLILFFINIVWQLDRLFKKKKKKKKILGKRTWWWGVVVAGYVTSETRIPICVLAMHRLLIVTVHIGGHEFDRGHGAGWVKSQEIGPRTKAMKR
jgi:hypothetical protein